MKTLVILCLLIVCSLANGTAQVSYSDILNEYELIKGINKFRTNPQSYIPILKNYTDTSSFDKTNKKLLNEQWRKADIANYVISELLKLTLIPVTKKFYIA